MHIELIAQRVQFVLCQFAQGAEVAQGSRRGMFGGRCHRVMLEEMLLVPCESARGPESLIFGHKKTRRSAGLCG
jgi:hypothetical protein